MLCDLLYCIQEFSLRPFVLCIKENLVLPWLITKEVMPPTGLNTTSSKHRLTFLLKIHYTKHTVLKHYAENKNDKINIDQIYYYLT